MNYYYHMEIMDGVQTKNTYPFGSITLTIVGSIIITLLVFTENFFAGLGVLASATTWYLLLKYFSKVKPSLDLISVGLISSAGNTYHAVSKDFNFREAWYRKKVTYYDSNGYECSKEHYYRKEESYYIREKILYPIFCDLYMEDSGEYLSNSMHYTLLKKFNYTYTLALIKKYGKHNHEIANKFFGTSFDATRFYTYDNPESISLLRLWYKEFRKNLIPIYDLKQKEDSYFVIDTEFVDIVDAIVHSKQEYPSLETLADSLHDKDITYNAEYPQKTKVSPRHIREAMWYRDLHNFLKVNN